MNIQKFFINGTEMNKIYFSDIVDSLEEKGINVNEAFETLADEKEIIYVSNGFVSGLASSNNQDGEWHHFFKKDIDGHFEAGKFKF